ncbi:hypothetical protein GOV09_02830 [Candidatus Woesearchaeota archaeon]|nr:hypothetical protein [Candidatus Woesearchaeota archaeon]
MSLIYRFKKEKLASGAYMSRPRIHVILGGKIPIEVPALIDSGCDITVIPEAIAEAIGLDMRGEKDILYGHREKSDVIQSHAAITFLGKAERQSVKLSHVPILINLKKGKEDTDEVTLGINGIFDAFDITFKKHQNKIIFKQVRE